MKRLAFLKLLLLCTFFISCEKGYKDEIFIEKYRSLYGKWQYQFTVTETGFAKNENYTIEFIPYGLFRYNGGKKGKVKIIEQNENTLQLDFDSLFPDVKYASIGVHPSGDSLGITPNNGMSSLYTRIE
jgi:hypothetical protein